ncbi:SpoIIE family protein phosphatase [Caldithrix abyssi]|nr:SpoIIE family protein phosphatase [Caldithrix abyssi]
MLNPMGWLQVLEKETNKKDKPEQAKSILVIDDEPDVTGTIRQYLNHYGYLVYEANSATEGLELYRQKKPHILITDLKMPVLSGLDILKAVREKDEDTEVIVLTAFGDTHFIIEALRNRASDFILKPVDLEMLKLTVEKSIRRIELKEQVKNYTQELEKVLNDVRKTKEYLQNILESSPQAIVTYDLEGKIIQWNSAAEKITGYSASDVKGKPLKEVLVLVDVLINPARDRNISIIEDVVGQILTKNGDLRYINRNAKILLDEQQRAIGVIENFYDVTDQVKSDQLLEKRYLQLQTINEIGKKIASCNDLAEISQFVSEKIVRTFFESSQLTIFFHEPQKDKLVLKAMSGYNIAKVQERFPVGSALDPEKGVIGRVFQTGQALIAEDVTKSPYFSEGISDETRSEFAFPIRFKDRVFGVLNIENIENISLDEADHFMLEAIAEYLGIAKDRIDLTDRIKEQNIQLEHQANELRKALTKVEKQKKIIEDQNKKLITDLQKASEFQKSLLPETLPAFEDVRFAALYVPSSQLGGDFYDVITIDDRYAAMVIADASGHGVAAAMLSAMFKMTLHKYSSEILNPAVVLEKMNRDFCGVLQSGEFFSAFLVVLDRQEMLLRFANAGHPRPLLYDFKTRQIQELDTNGFLLGILDMGINFEQKEIKINDHSRLFLYTDGLNEAMNDKEEQYGVDRLKDLMIENAEQSADEFVKQTRESLHRYTGSDEFEDDVTILVLDKIGANHHA